MRVCYTADDVRSGPVAPNTLVDRFVEDAIEVDVDAVGDGEDAIVAAVMEHVEEAGVHSGDSACVIPPLSIGPELESEIRRQTELLVRGLGVQGLCNVQFALHEGTIYVLEANPRASRTVPFVCKAMGIDLVDLACRVTTGSRLAEMNVVIPEPRVVAVKEVVLPFARFPGLGPRARAGDALDRRGDGARARLRDDLREGDARSRAAPAGAAERAPRGGVPLGLRPRQAGRDAARAAARRPRLRPRRDARHGAPHRAARHRGDRGREGGGRATATPSSTSCAAAQVDLIVNTPVGRGARADGYQIRRAAISAKVPCITTLAGASAAVQAIARAWQVEPKSLQELHA